MSRSGRTSMRDRNPVVVGAVGLLVVAAAIAGAFAFGTIGLGDDGYTLTAVFERTGGLEPKADVRVAGVSVGTVTRIDPDFDRGLISVTFEVDADVDLGEETTAEIAAATLLGGYYLRLDGVVTSPHLDELPEDDPRRTIPVDRTVGPTSLNEALDATTGAVSAIDLDAANRLLQQVAGATNRNRDQLPVLLDNFNVVATAVANRDAEIRRLAVGADTLTATLASRDAELAQLVESADRLLAQLAVRRDEITTILADGATVVGIGADLLATHRAAIDQLLSDVSTITSRLGDELPAVNQALTQAQTLFPLLIGTLDPAGGFSIRGEGLIVHPGQLEQIIDTVDELLAALGVAP
jgi:phospholipid/cholesterol/gamma-HCH transport system substrate-binding protein